MNPPETCHIVVTLIYLLDARPRNKKRDTFYDDRSSWLCRQLNSSSLKTNRTSLPFLWTLLEWMRNKDNDKIKKARVAFLLHWKLNNFVLYDYKDYYSSMTVHFVQLCQYWGCMISVKPATGGTIFINKHFTIQCSVAALLDWTVLLLLDISRFAWLNVSSLRP